MFRKRGEVQPLHEVMKDRFDVRRGTAADHGISRQWFTKTEPANTVAQPQQVQQQLIGCWRLLMLDGWFFVYG